MGILETLDLQVSTHCMVPYINDPPVPTKILIVAQIIYKACMDDCEESIF